MDPTSRTDEVLEIAERIFEERRTVEKLRQLQAETNRKIDESERHLEKLRADLAALVDGPPKPTGPYPGSNPNSMATRVQEILAGDPARVMDAAEIARGLGGDVDMASLRSTLHRLSNDLRIEKVDRGRYRGRKDEAAAQNHSPEGEEATV